MIHCHLSGTKVAKECLYSRALAPFTDVMAENNHLISIKLLDDRMVVTQSYHFLAPGLERNRGHLTKLVGNNSH